MFICLNYLFCLIALDKISSLVLNRSCKSKHHCLVFYFGEKIQSFTLNMMLTVYICCVYMCVYVCVCVCVCVYFVDELYELKGISFSPLLEISILRKVSSLSNALSSVIEMTI